MVQIPETSLRSAIRLATLRDERECANDLIALADLAPAARQLIVTEAAGLVREIRTRGDAGLMEKFLAEYGLNTDEGVALMCLAEAYLRTPDAETLDALISDKIGDGDWARHLGKAQSGLVNASTWALMLTGRVFRTIPAEADDLGSVVHTMVRRLGEPVVRTAIGEAMKLLGRQFVLGRDIEEAINHAVENPRGELHSFDMLGEAARTGADAQRYFEAYAAAIRAIGARADAGNPHDNNGISVKLSALHPRYETVNRSRVLDELVPRVVELANLAASFNIALAIDAEEADRLDLSLDVIDAVLANIGHAGWAGFGVVVQAYMRRAPFVLDWLYDLAGRNGRRISVRLVKGAYWDTEIKNAQILGLTDYPVFTRKQTTDLSYLACARKLLSMTDRIYPQFATHNAHTVTAINNMAGRDVSFEFQRLHGMGESLHALAAERDERRRRVYAPVGVHEDLLAYLVRRLLENGANSSFVHQILDSDVPPERICADPVDAVEDADPLSHPAIVKPLQLYSPDRRNSHGWNLNDPVDLAKLDDAMAHWRGHVWGASEGRPLNNPAERADLVGHVRDAIPDDAATAIEQAKEGFEAWSKLSGPERAIVLDKTADLYEENAAELMALCVREAGKNRLDAIAEIREAVDFLRYYGWQAGAGQLDGKPLGPVLCISPWNFPLAIFTGQISGALAAGNSVIAKPAEQTPLVAARAAELFLQVGLPQHALVLVQGDGATIGPPLTGDPGIAGIAFTGSTDTARLIEISVARTGNHLAPFIAETGGLNAMIVDSTSLPEQAVRDILISAFQSAGQRCSALRVLFVQRDVAPDVLEMLEGAARELKIGDPWDPSTDVGPVIDEEARRTILDHCELMKSQGRLLFELDVPKGQNTGTFVAPSAFRLNALSELKQEIFGPVLHVIEFDADEIDKVVDDINASGYGLTLGVHSRIDTRVDRICERADVGNIYVNRNQIGAVVGVQPFGGEGLSGTGPKAGGPSYARRFTVSGRQSPSSLMPQLMPGPTGERNSYRLYPRGLVACLGPGAEAQSRQAAMVREAGVNALVATPEDAAFQRALVADHIDAAMFEGDIPRQWRVALAEKTGRRIPFLNSAGDRAMLYVERSISEDTTASGGNASLLSSVS